MSEEEKVVVIDKRRQEKAEEDDRLLKAAADHEAAIARCKEAAEAFGRLPVYEQVLSMLGAQHAVMSNLIWRASSEGRQRGVAPVGSVEIHAEALKCHELSLLSTRIGLIVLSHIAAAAGIDVYKLFDAPKEEKKPGDLQ